MASSPGPRVYVIAEAGVNHNGDPELALELVDAAAAAGADAVKFQTFRAEAVASARAAKAGYQTRTTEAGETQFAMLKRLELPQRVFHGLARRCARLSIEFLSTPFDAESLRFLVEDLNLESLKMASGEITNAPLLLAASRSGRKVILSTGMSTLDEVVDALGVLAFGYTRARAAPSRRTFRAAFGSKTGLFDAGRVELLMKKGRAYTLPRVGNRDNMAFVLVLSTMLLDDIFVRGARSFGSDIETKNTLELV